MQCFLSRRSHRAALLLSLSLLFTGVLVTSCSPSSKRANEKSQKQKKKGKKAQSPASGSGQYSMGEGWMPFEFKTWKDKMGNDVRYQSGSVLWSENSGKSWFDANGLWQGTDSRWYRFDTARHVFRSTMAQESMWVRVDNDEWPTSSGNILRMDGGGNLWARKK